jgi:dihydrodipicolinate synthase/N-acetylneuraminate lyase
VDATDLRGVWGTVLLPIATDDSIDWRSLQRQVDHLVNSDLNGVYTHGTAGEFHTLSESEYDRVNDLLARACAGTGMRFQIGATHPSAQTTAQRVARARVLSPAAIQVILPDWVPLNDDEVVRFIERVVECADPVPVVLYNPPHAKTAVTPEMLGRLLARAPGLIGVKVADGDDAWYARMRAYADRCALFVPGHRLASGIARGAHGSYSNVAALSPNGAAAWYRLMQHDMPAAADVEHRLATFFDRQVVPLQAQGFANPALDKFLACVGGWCQLGTRTRWPTQSVPESRVRPAREQARVLLPELIGE